MITRRTLLRNTAAAAVAAPVLVPMAAQAAPGGGRLKQSACKWCYPKMTLDELCQNAQRIGLKGIDAGRHAVDAIALEVERIGESQRYARKILEQRAANPPTEDK